MLMKKTRDIKSNIYNLYIIKIAKWFMLFMPIIVIFYDSFGFNEQKITLLLAIYSITIAILEIPSGYLADVWGRKKTIVLGLIFSFLGFLIYSVTKSFLSFASAEIFLGIGHSLVSGADSALLYDSLIDLNKKNEFVKYEGRMVSVGNFSEAVAGIAGGFLADLNIRYPFLGQSIITFIAIPAALLLIEPSRHEALENYNFKNILKIVKHTLIDYKVLRYAILFSAIIGTATLSMAWFAQFYLKHVNLKLSYFGIVWTALNLTVGIFSFLSYKIENKIGHKKSLWFIAISIPFGYIFLSNYAALWAISILFLFYVFRGIATPILKDYINRYTKSNVRATVLSVRNLIIRVFFSIIYPFLGWYIVRYTLNQALLLAGISFFVFSLITILLYFKSLE